jgi:hypothetical protein
MYLSFFVLLGHARQMVSAKSGRVRATAHTLEYSQSQATNQAKFDMEKQFFRPKFPMETF